LVCIFSTDDPYVSRKNIEFFDKKLNANIIKINKRGHIDKKNDYKIILDIFNKFFKK
jgi:predicted alpha/beta hydrolase family esterase